MAEETKNDTQTSDLRKRRTLLSVECTPRRFGQSSPVDPGALRRIRAIEYARLPIDTCERLRRASEARYVRLLRQRSIFPSVI